MATIDKTLPNQIRTKEDLPGPEEQAQEIQLPEEAQKGPIEMTPTEDGGMEIDFDPAAMAMQQGAGNDINANLADFLEPNVLDPIGSEMTQNYEDFKSSRDDWEPA